MTLLPTTRSAVWASLRMPGNSAISPDTSPLDACIVGAGLMGRWHARAIGRVGGRVVSVVDVDPRAARSLAEETGASTSSRLDDALNRTGAHVVHVCTPPDTHEALADIAFAHGSHVLCEKPLAPDAATVARMYRSASDHGRLLCPVHQYARQDGFVRAQDMVSHAGRLLHVDAVACSAGAADNTEEAYDRLAREILPHPLSLLWELLGDLPADWAARRVSDGEWRLLGSSGKTGVGIVLSARGRPTRNTLRLICERQTIHVDLFHGFALSESGVVSRRAKLVRPFRLGLTTWGAAGSNLLRRALSGESAFPGLRSLIASFYHAARDGLPAPFCQAHGQAVATAQDAIGRLIGTTSGGSGG